MFIDQMDLIWKPWHMGPQVLPKIILMETLYCYIHHKTVKSGVWTGGIDLSD